MGAGSIGYQARTLLMGMLLFVSSVAAAAPVPWFVPDEQAASRLSTWLEQLWPDHPVEVRVGESPGRGIWYQAGALHLRSDAHQEQAAVADDPALQITTVRTWLAAIPVDDQGWAPEMQVAPPPEVSASEAPDTRDPVRVLPLPEAGFGLTVRPTGSGAMVGTRLGVALMAAGLPGGAGPLATSRRRCGPSTAT